MILKTKTIEKAMLKELLITFLLALIAFNFLFMTEKLMKLTRLLSSVGASLFDMMKIISFVQPGLFILTAPLSFLIAVLLTYGRLNSDNELTAMRAAGMSFTSISAPVRLFGMMCFLTAIFFSFYLAPKGAVRLRETVSRVISERTPLAVEAGAFYMAFPGIVMYVNEKPSKDTLEDVFIYDEREKDRPMSLFAKQGRLSVGDGYAISLSLSDGFVHIPRDNASTEMFFEKYRFTIPIPIKESSRKRGEFTPAELIREASKADEKERIKLMIEFHRRLSFPAMCLILTLLGPPLSLVAGRAGRLGGLIIGLVVFAAYYIALIYGERLSIAGTVPHYISAWGPYIVFGILSFLLFRKAASK